MARYESWDGTAYLLDFILIPYTATLKQNQKYTGS